MQEFYLDLFGYLFFAQLNAQLALLELADLVPKKQAYEQEEHHIDDEGPYPITKENTKEIGHVCVFNEAWILHEVNNKLENEEQKHEGQKYHCGYHFNFDPPGHSGKKKG